MALSRALAAGVVGGAPGPLRGAPGLLRASRAGRGGVTKVSRSLGSGFPVWPGFWALWLPLLLPPSPSEQAGRAVAAGLSPASRLSMRRRAGVRSEAGRPQAPPEDTPASNTAAQGEPAAKGLGGRRGVTSGDREAMARGGTAVAAADS